MAIGFGLICDWLTSAQELKSTNQNSKPVIRDRTKRGKKEPEQVVIGFSLVLTDLESGTKLFSLSQSLAVEFQSSHLITYSANFTKMAKGNSFAETKQEFSSAQDKLILPDCNSPGAKQNKVKVIMFLILITLLTDYWLPVMAVGSMGVGVTSEVDLPVPSTFIVDRRRKPPRHIQPPKRNTAWRRSLNGMGICIDNMHR